MAGLPTYFGNPTSAHAQEHLEITGLGHFLPLSPYREQNDLTALHFEGRLGHGKVFQLEIDGERDAERERPRQLAELPRLFGEQVTWHKLASLVAQGAEVRTTRLNEAFDVDADVATHARRLLPLFCIDVQEQIRVASDQSPSNPSRGSA